jgi:hypothetical protein
MTPPARWHTSHLLSPTPAHATPARNALRRTPCHPHYLSLPPQARAAIERSAHRTQTDFSKNEAARRLSALISRAAIERSA